MSIKAFTFLFSVGFSVLCLSMTSRASQVIQTSSPNYEIVFPKNHINEMKLIISAQDWAAMQANMRKLYGEPNAPRPPGGGGPGQPPGTPKEKPMWVNGQLFFNGELWQNVGLRYKGNSSLMSSWSRGSHKLPFKIDFEKYETKRKFFGFTELSLSNNFADDTFLREPFVYQLFEDMGLPASRTALYKLIVDYGEGEKDYGIYTAIEVSNDTVVKRYFGEDKGNIYEGDGRGVTLAKDVTTEQIQSFFEKENNKKEADWSDITNLYTVLHDSKRLTNSEEWRADLEKIFEVKSFLRWLAMSAVLEHWDTYGGMTHNFYLYNKNGKLHWISWDHNLVLSAKMGAPRPPGNGGDMPPFPPPPGNRPPGGGGPGGGMGKVTFDKTDVTDKWPLIRFLMDDDLFNREYHEQLKDIQQHYFDTVKIEADLRQKAEVIKLSLSDGEIKNFETSTEDLIKKIHERRQKLIEYLQQKP